MQSVGVPPLRDEGLVLRLGLCLHPQVLHPYSGSPQSVVVVEAQGAQTLPPMGVDTVVSPQGDLSHLLLPLSSLLNALLQLAVASGTLLAVAQRPPVVVVVVVAVVVAVAVVTLRRLPTENSQRRWTLRALEKSLPRKPHPERLHPRTT